ncbi:MAG TPA: thioredoxin domain-containing protein [Candidatus Limnocylindrales bacterium]
MNRLAGETSPYLLQHAHNPVDWYPWGPEALAAARDGDKPIFLSIGYAACHWCHVMERESFEDEATAADLRRDFIAIKVDREERPDLDQVYMSAVQALTGSGGWPMSVFLTPDGRPFYGGTYFPPEARHGLPAFRQVLAGVATAWREDRPAVESSGQRLVEALVDHQRVEADGGDVDAADAVLDRAGVALEAAAAALETSFDARRGGWGGAPKFPQSMTIEFLLRRSVGPDADGRGLAMARRTLDTMAAGGIHDQLGGGFHRYATDANWLVPHFEQMLYDNAQLARVYVHAWQLTGETAYRDVAVGTLDFMDRRLKRSDGTFAASLDADTGGVEGATFTWTAAEIRDALGPAGPEPFCAAYGVTEEGNWEGRTILSRVASDAELAARFPDVGTGLEPALAGARTSLLERRDRRPQPARDDKAIAAWNGLAIAAFAEAAAALSTASELESPARSLGERYRSIAQRAAEVVLSDLRSVDGRLRRSWKDGRATATGVLEDHADLADGLLALYEATFDERWFAAAQALADIILDHFADPAGGFFDTADDAETLVTRPRDLQDNALPSGGAMASTVLLRLAALTGETRYRTAAERALAAVLEVAPRHPTFFAQWLIALDFAAVPVAEVAIVGTPTDHATAALVGVARRGYRPHRVLAAGPEPQVSGVPLLQGRFALHGRPTAFVCRDFACRQPVHEPEALEALLVEAGQAFQHVPWTTG